MKLLILSGVASSWKGKVCFLNFGSRFFWNNIYIDMNNGRWISKLCHQHSKTDTMSVTPSLSREFHDVTNISVAIITCKLIKVDVYTKAISKKVFHDQCDQERFTHLNYVFSLWATADSIYLPDSLNQWVKLETERFWAWLWVSNEWKCTRA